MKDPDGLEGICETYDGTEYIVSGEEVDFVSPSGSVALNTVVYIQGRGLNIRCVSVPGSDEHMFAEETEPFGICGCNPPAVWHFTAVSSEGHVRTYDTLDGHEAVHLLRHPDHLLEENYDGGGFATGINLIPEEMGLNVVFRELQDAMIGIGVLEDDGAIKVTEIQEVDTEELFNKFMEMLGDDV